MNDYMKARREVIEQAVSDGNIIKDGVGNPEIAIGAGPAILAAMLDKVGGYALDADSDFLTTHSADVFSLIRAFSAISPLATKLATAFAENLLGKDLDNVAANALAEIEDDVGPFDPELLFYKDEG